MRPPSTGSVKMGDPYLLSYTKQLLMLGNVLKDDPNIGTRNYFDLMKKTPRTILAELVFESKNCTQMYQLCLFFFLAKSFLFWPTDKKAEKLASELDLDLVVVVLESLANTSSAVSSISTQASRPLVVSSSSSSSSSSSLKRESLSSSGHFPLSVGQAGGHSLDLPAVGLGSSFGPQTAPPGLHGSSSLLDPPNGPTPGELQLHRPTPRPTNSSDLEKSYLLNMDLLEYLKRASPIASVLACVLRSPTDRFDPSIFEFALSTAKVRPWSSPSPHFPSLTLSLSRLSCLEAVPGPLPLDVLQNSRDFTVLHDFFATVLRKYRL